MTTPDMAPNITSLSGQEAAAALDAILVTSVLDCVTLPGYGLSGGVASR